MLNNRKKIWKMLYDILPEGWDEMIVEYEGIQEYEVAVQDIVDDIEELAQKIEDKMKSKSVFAND